MVGLGLGRSTSVCRVSFSPRGAAVRNPICLSSAWNEHKWNTAFGQANDCLSVTSPLSRGARLQLPVSAAHPGQQPRPVHTTQTIRSNAPSQPKSHPPGNRHRFTSVNVIDVARGATLRGLKALQFSGRPDGAYTVRRFRRFSFRAPRTMETTVDFLHEWLRRSNRIRLRVPVISPRRLVRLERRARPLSGLSEAASRQAPGNWRFFTGFRSCASIAAARHTLASKILTP